MRETAAEIIGNLDKPNEIRGDDLRRPSATLKPRIGNILPNRASELKAVNASRPHPQGRDHPGI